MVLRGRLPSTIRGGFAPAGPKDLRALPAGFHTAVMVDVVLLLPGEAANSERIIAE